MCFLLISAVLTVLGARQLAEGVYLDQATKRAKVIDRAMSGSYLLWLAASVYGWLLVFAAVLGLGYGVRIALMPVILIELFGLQSLGAVLGVFFTATGISALIGPPLAGFIVDYTGSYRWAAALALAMGLLGFAAVLRLRADRVSASL